MKGLYLVLRMLAIFSAISLMTGNALAVDGVIEINQARAIAGDKYVSDPPGFPVTINNPGSYILTSNLNVPKDIDGIEINTSKVTIDLNGFVINGHGGSSGRGITSMESGSGMYDNIKIYNGVVTNMAEEGVFIGSYSHIENMEVYDNNSHGIRAYKSSTIINSKAYSNKFNGIIADSCCILKSNVADNNGYNGITSEDSSTVISNTAQNNGSRGIYAGTGSTVSENSAQDNAKSGITAGAGSAIISNAAYGNDKYGIVTYSGSSVCDNTVRGNTDYGLELGSNAGYKNNVLTNNNGGNSNDQVSGGIEMGMNVCGTNTDCP